MKIHKADLNIGYLSQVQFHTYCDSNSIVQSLFVTLNNFLCHCSSNVLSSSCSTGVVERTLHYNIDCYRTGAEGILKRELTSNHHLAPQSPCPQPAPASSPQRSGLLCLSGWSPSRRQPHSPHRRYGPWHAA